VNTTPSATSASPSTTSTGGGDSNSGGDKELSQESTFTNFNEILREREALPCEVCFSGVNLTG